MDNSFWRQTATFSHNGTKTSIPDRVDALVVGAGYTGLCAAARLAAAGAHVAVIDRSGVGGGASASNGGIVAPGPNGPYAEVRRVMGAETVRHLMHLSRRVVDMLQEIAQSSPIDVELSLPGHLVLATSDGECATLRNSAAMLERDGFFARWIERQDLPVAIAAGSCGGLLLEGGFVHSGRLVAALARRAESSGAHIFSGLSLLGYEHGKDGIEAIIGPENSRVRTTQLLLATNAWTARVAPRVPVTPQRGQVLVTEPLEPLLPYAIGARSGFDYYHQRRDGRIVMGGGRDWDLTTEATDTPALNRRLQERLVQFVCELAGRPVAIEAQWSGIMGFTPDNLPIAGEWEPGVFVAAGFSGHGVVVAPEVGRLVADHMLGESAEALRVFDPHRFLSA